jgi:hypothetical protein
MLAETIAEYVVNPSPDNEDALHNFGTEIAKHLEEPQYTPEEVDLGSNVARPSLPSQELYEFISYACGSEKWGGVMLTDRQDLKSAVKNFRTENFEIYNPDDPRQGVHGQCLFSLLRHFDSYIEDNIFTDILNRLVSARKELVTNLGLLLASPLVLFGGFPEARQALDDYLNAYGDLFREFRRHEADLHRRDSNALKYVATEMLRLDIIHFRIDTPTERKWKGMLTPMHPFHLWRFREILKVVHSENWTLSEEEREGLTKTLPNLPHLLHFLVFSPDVTESQDVVLPQARHYELLPTYENQTNQYLGTDGIDFITNLLNRWLEYAPYSRYQIRLGLIDTPSLSFTLRAIARFLENSPDTTAVVDAYFTRGQEFREDLASLEYDGKDFELSEMLRSGQLVINLYDKKSLEEVSEIICQRPVHIAYAFDQSHYSLDYGPRARHLLVSPLVVTHQYEYSETFRRGTIAPSSEAEEGIFADYHFLVERAARLPAGQQLRLQYGDDVDLEPLNNLLENKAVKWLALADRVLTPYAPTAAIPLDERKSDQREIAVWAPATSRAIKYLIDLLRQFNLRPDEQRVADLLRQFGHIAAEGFLSLSKIGGSAASREARQKGFLGTVLAAAWYRSHYPGALIASLDSNLARQWLQSRSQGAGRADLIGLRTSNNDELIIDVIEVKTRADRAEVKEIKTSSGERRLAGHAVEQLEAVLETLKPIFGAEDIELLFTPARREALKYQLYRECFREVHIPEWQGNWYERLNAAFSLPTPRIPVRLRGMVLHVQMEADIDSKPRNYENQALTLMHLGAKSIQSLIGGQLTADPEVKAARRESVAQAESPSTDGETVKQDVSVKEHIEARQKQTFLRATSAVVERPAAEVVPLIEVSETNQQEEVRDLARRFLRACQSYQIQIDECNTERAIVGPTVLRFYVRLSRGQRLAPLINVLEDISREMQRSGLLVTTIPNSTEVALDVPRTTKGGVPLTRGLSKLPAVKSTEQMPIPIGVTPEGLDFIQDLGQMPHLLVGGTTGAGKTMFLYGLLVALVTTHPDPSTLRILLSASKPEDFGFFVGLPHLEAGGVIAEASKAVETLQTHISHVFDERQELLTKARCRDIGDYNTHNSPKLPPLVVIVDEFADLADQLAGDRSGRDAFYTHLRRVAQLGRNRGVHLVLCTQRPSADLVPTNIRTLMNCRVALRVNDSTASRMILDESGAEQLQMHGDLLFKEQNILTRAQGYYVSSAELRKLLRPFCD